MKKLNKYILDRYKETEIDKIYNSRGEYTNTPFPKDGSGIKTGETLEALKSGISIGDTIVEEIIDDDKIVYGLSMDTHRNVALGMNEEWLMSVLDDYFKNDAVMDEIMQEIVPEAKRL